MQTFLYYHKKLVREWEWVPWKVGRQTKSLQILTQGHYIANPRSAICFVFTCTGNIYYIQKSGKFLNFSLICCWLRRTVTIFWGCLRCRYNIDRYCGTDTEKGKVPNLAPLFSTHSYRMPASAEQILVFLSPDAMK